MPSNYSGWIYRSKRPVAFWWGVGVFVVVAIACFALDWLNYLTNFLAD